MSTIGNGVDIIENSRIEKAIKKVAFIERVFSKKEIELSLKYKNKTNYYAKRFSAKEAFYKALGTGIREGNSFKYISIQNDKNGKPFIEINNQIKKMIFKRFKLKKFKIHLSLSDEKKHSIAFVILDKI
ncbi:MAG: holo-ACP synthase [Candidatus Pelagibacter sp. TMED118]|nr:MAG: holo-ACP synthase [Candidatus Pelagibacter sp. TMED118]|tara:strand:+ start:2344 stop:2730 length:387 start_codon:yes stop_codon:yes gene_type:complete